MAWTYTRQLMNEGGSRSSSVRSSSKNAPPTVRAASKKTANPIKSPSEIRKTTHSPIIKPSQSIIRQQVHNKATPKPKPSISIGSATGEMNTKLPNPASSIAKKPNPAQPKSQKPRSTHQSQDNSGYKVIEISDDSSDESSQKLKPSSSKPTAPPLKSSDFAVKSTENPRPTTEASQVNPSKDTTEHKPSTESSQVDTKKASKKADKSTTNKSSAKKKSNQSDKSSSRTEQKEIIESDTEKKSLQKKKVTNKQPNPPQIDSADKSDNKKTKSKKDKQPDTSKAPTEQADVPPINKTSTATKKPESADSNKKTTTTLKRTRQESSQVDDEKQPRQTRQTAQIDKDAPVKKKARQQPEPSKVSENKGVHKREMIENEPTKVKRTQNRLPIFDETYKLKVVIKGHTETNIPVRIDDDDFEDSKDLWACAFEPGTEVAAICGSYTVLFLDTEQGRYIKKYTHAEVQEVFYCMSWTTLKGEESLNENITQEDECCRILAVAGRLGSIKLLNPLQNECYRYLFGHRKPVLGLSFCKSNPRWLFSASADKTVRLWDIGSPTSKTDDAVCLAQFVLPAEVDEPSALSVSYDGSKILVGTRTGDMIRFDVTAKQLQKIKNTADEFRKNLSSIATKTSVSVMNIKHAFIYPHGDEWHEGYIDDLCILGQDGDKKNPMHNRIVSRGSEDMEILVWNSVKSKKTDADIDKSLEWPDSGGGTGLKFKVVESEEQKVLLAGDYDGQIHIFNVGDEVKSKTLKDNSKEQLPAARILSHRMSEELIRDVCCSSDTRTIVAVDNNNTAFIWSATAI